MAEICSIDVPTSISYSTSNTLAGLSPTVKALLSWDGQQYANAWSTWQSMFAIKPEVEIWPRVGCFRFVGERTYLSMVSEKIRRIYSETAEIWRVNLVPRPKTTLRAKILSPADFHSKSEKNFVTTNYAQACWNALKREKNMLLRNTNIDGLSRFFASPKTARYRTI